MCPLNFCWRTAEFICHSPAGDSLTGGTPGSIFIHFTLFAHAVNCFDIDSVFSVIAATLFTDICCRS